METKTCTACKETKPLTEFYIRNGKPNGGKCKACFRITQKAGMMKPPKLQTPSGTKWCQDCKTILPIAEFWANKNFHDGLDRMCRGCRYARHRAWANENRPRLAEAQTRRYQSDPERYADYELKKKYGIAPGTYDAMLADQGGVCAICNASDPGGTRLKRFHVDHDHTTGQIRGLLCAKCNTGIGQMRHSKQILLDAITYLGKYSDSAESSGV